MSGTLARHLGLREDRVPGTEGSWAGHVCVDRWGAQGCCPWRWGLEGLGRLLEAVMSLGAQEGRGGGSPRPKPIVSSSIWS